MPDHPPTFDGSTPTLLILCRDLLLGSRITAAAQSGGVSFRVVRDPAKLAAQAGARLIVDLNQEGAIDAAAAWKAAGSREVVGFVSHLDAATIQRARQAGLDHVMARSAFVEHLPSIVHPELK